MRLPRRIALVRLAAIGTALKTAAVVCVLMLGAQASANTLRVAVSRSTLSLPFWIAKEQGFFAQHQVDVELVDCIGGQRCLAQLLEGKAQLATASELPVVFESFNRTDFAIIATFATSDEDVKLLGHKDAGIRGVADLKGKRVGTISRSSSAYYLDTLLLFAGVDPSTVSIVPLQPETAGAALAARQVDAAAFWEPYANKAQRDQRGSIVRVSTPRVYTQTFNLITDRSTMNRSSPALQALLRALVAAQTYILQNPDAAKASLQRYLELDAEFVNAIWPHIQFRLGLEQRLLSLIESEARWAVRERHVAKPAKMPDYLMLVEPKFLREVRPDAVTIR